MVSAREIIIKDYSEWCAFSSTRSGFPRNVKKSRQNIYPSIRKPKYDEILSGSKITQMEFEEWHKENTIAICNAASGLPVGWAVKLINIYLKTRVYIAGEGRVDLIRYIHPPKHR